MRGPRAGEATCRRPRPRDEWIPIPVPAIIDEPTHQSALAQLARNSVLNFRRNTRNSYLLRCLLVCRTCGLAMHGTTTRDKQGNLIQGYYRCHGKDPSARDREHRCPQSRVKVEELDAAVWAHVCQLLDDPATLLAQFEALARPDAADAPGGPAGEDKAEAQLRRLDREGKRLLDAYQAEVIELAELRERQRGIEGRRQVLLAQRDQQAQLREERRTARQVWGDLTAFCERIRSRLGEAMAAERQQILQLLVERVIVGEDALEIRHVIPLRRLKPEPVAPVPAGDGGEGQAPARSSEEPPGTPEPRLRSDGVHHAPDVRGPALVDRVVPGVPVGVDEPLVSPEERGRGVPGSADREVEHGVRVRGIPDVDPGVGRPPRGQENHRGVVGVERGRPPDSVAHQSVQRFENPGTRDDLIAQGGPGHLPLQSPEDRLLAVQRQVIDVLRHDDVGEQPGRRGPAGNRLGWERGLNHLRIVPGALTNATHVTRPNDLTDE
jgi:hypothetical protein